VYCNDLYLKHFAHTKPEVLAPARKGIVGHVIIHPTAQVHPSAVIGPNVTIGANAVIGAGVRISHSIVLDRVEVRDRACVLYTILAWDSVVGSWARIEGIPNQTPHLYVGEKRQGVTIIGRESVAEREITVRNCIVMPHKVLERSVYNEILL
jgi:mannose-1-phosphate guanylyltransferase